MVRFIIDVNQELPSAEMHLHSNMVRFIIHTLSRNGLRNEEFTFQYG